MATLTKQEAADRIREIQETMAELAGELKEIAQQVDDVHAERSVVANLQCLIDDNHGYLSRDYNLTRWIEDLEQNENESED
jgi:hypothetical protein